MQELAFGEIKTHLNGRAVPIRSKSPAGGVREVHGLMPAHHLVRSMMHDLAVTSHDVDRLSFVNSLWDIRRQLPESPPVATGTWHGRLLLEVHRQKLRPQHDRWYAQVVKQKTSNWDKKRFDHREPPRPTKAFAEGVVLLI